jgi:hypothetical protein
VTPNEEAQAGAKHALLSGNDRWTQRTRRGNHLSDTGSSGCRSGDRCACRPAYKQNWGRREDRF